MAKRDADVYIVDNGIAVNRIITSHPVNTEIYASEIVLPSFERMDDVARRIESPWISAGSRRFWGS